MSGHREVRERLPVCFPAVWPCEAICAAFPVWVASLPHSTPKTTLSRPVSRVCGEELESAGAVGTQGLRGTKKVQEKERGSRSASRSVHTVPQCGSGQRFAGFWTGDQCGGKFRGAGVRFDPA